MLNTFVTISRGIFLNPDKLPGRTPLRTWGFFNDSRTCSGSFEHFPSNASASLADIRGITWDIYIYVTLIPRKDNDVFSYQYPSPISVKGLISPSNHQTSPSPTSLSDRRQVEIIRHLKGLRFRLPPCMRSLAIHRVASHLKTRQSTQVYSSQMYKMQYLRRWPCFNHPVVLS